MKFARTCAGIGAVLSVGFVLALGCEHFASLLDAAITTALALRSTPGGQTRAAPVREQTAKAA